MISIEAVLIIFHFPDSKGYPGSTAEGYAPRAKHTQHNRRETDNEAATAHALMLMMKLGKKRSDAPYRAGQSRGKELPSVGQFEGVFNQFNTTHLRLQTDGNNIEAGIV